MYSKPLIFMIISVLVVALIFSPTAISHVFAVPPNSKFGTAEADCTNNVKELTATCCWSRVTFDKVLYECQTCNINTNTGNFEECTPVTRERGGGVLILPYLVEVFSKRLQHLLHQMTMLIQIVEVYLIHHKQVEVYL